jgi:hypothetical protein
MFHGKLNTLHLILNVRQFYGRFHKSFTRGKRTRYEKAQRRQKSDYIRHSNLTPQKVNVVRSDEVGKVRRQSFILSRLV